MSLKIKEGAIFIADAHESQKRKDFYELLCAIKEKKIITTQLFLMGDIFDLLVGKVQNCVNKNKQYIELLDDIATEIEVFYFEGNHDFCLEDIFSYVKVFPIQNQPVEFFLENGQSALLSHGDKYGDKKHQVYTSIIRSPKLLLFLNFLDILTRNFISNYIERRLLQKNICTTIKDFEQIAQRNIDLYVEKKYDFILEGHFHQNRQFQVNEMIYINFSSFACNQSYFIVKFSNGAKFAQKKLRGCNV